MRAAAYAVAVPISPPPTTAMRRRVTRSSGRGRYARGVSSAAAMRGFMVWIPHAAGPFCGHGGVGDWGRAWHRSGSGRAFRPGRRSRRVNESRHFFDGDEAWWDRVLDLAPYGIRVNAVAPGSILTV